MGSAACDDLLVGAELDGLFLRPSPGPSALLVVSTRLKCWARPRQERASVWLAAWQRVEGRAVDGVDSASSLVGALTNRPVDDVDALQEGNRVSMIIVMWSLLLCCPGAVLVVADAPVSRVAQPDEGAIRDLEAGLAVAWGRRDVKAVGEVLAEDFQYWLFSGVRRGKADLLKVVAGSGDGGDGYGGRSGACLWGCGGLYGAYRGSVGGWGGGRLDFSDLCDGCIRAAGRAVVDGGFA